MLRYSIAGLLVATIAGVKLPAAGAVADLRYLPRVLIPMHVQCLDVVHYEAGRISRVR